ncbi:hypothetical protein Scep_018662 [Stephania cephalantha]|uniref:O-acyltransferase WSD1 C-terminal domain-containing protein n=1 Tax=Stephania cephalantha TaxID=152367 RepID=A0AAP0NLE1_9MAGN
MAMKKVQFSVEEEEENEENSFPPLSPVVEDIVVIHAFPFGLSPEECEQHLEEYLSKIGTERFSMDRPLWEVHMIKYYPTASGTGGAVVFKICHAIGDGYSLVSLLMKAFQRADDPLLPLSFPNITLRSKIVRNKINGYGFGFALKCFNTISDVGAMLLRSSSWLKDHKTAVRSEKPLQEHLEPIVVSVITLPLEDIKQVKAKVEGESMKRIRDSALVHFTMPVVKMLNHMKGTEALAEFIYSTMKNTTTLVTNVIGPNEKMAMAGYPSLVFTVISYMGSLNGKGLH